MSNYDKLNLIFPIQKCRYEKKIYEFDRIPIVEDKVFYGERVRLKNEFGYTLFPYSYDIFPKSLRSFVFSQTNDFKKNFVENGLGYYGFKTVKGTNELDHRAYIFLNYLGNSGLYLLY